MSGLSTHVLDLTTGRPAAGVRVRLRRLSGDVSMLAECLTDLDGRTRLLEAGDLQTTSYRLTFDIGAYYGRCDAVTDPPFLDEVTIDFGVADPARHHHVPLLVSPFGYSTYRGS